MAYKISFILFSNHRQNREIAQDYMLYSLFVCCETRVWKITGGDTANGNCALQHAELWAANFTYK